MLEKLEYRSINFLMAVLARIVPVNLPEITWQPPMVGLSQMVDKLVTKQISLSPPGKQIIQELPIPHL